MERIISRIGIRLLTGLVVCALSCTAVWSQGTAQITGAVKDQTGAVLPGVGITVTQTATGAKRNVASDETGSYTLPNLPIGPYMLEAELPGFRTYVQSGIVLQVDSSPTINIILQVGQVSDQIEVQANAALVETHSTSIGTVVDNQRVLEMPLNGRNVTELIFLAGIANVAAGTFLNSVRNYPTVQIAVAGGLGNWTTYNFDGTAHNDAYNSLNLPLPFPDALQEFKVESSALPAQNGMHASATVNVVTKSGTNEFHGDMFEFVRNGIFNARDFFAPKRDTLKRNQFGGVVGGPIKKNKIFFFGGYQGTIQRSAPAQTIEYVPTPAMLAGDFTAFAAPPCQPRQVTLSAARGFLNNRISPALFSAAALKVEALLPQTSDPCGLVNVPLKSNQSENMGVTRLDWQKNDRHSMFARFFITNLNIDSTYDGHNALTVSSNGQHDRVYSLSLGSTYLISSNVVNSFHAGASRSAIPKIVDNVASWPELGVNAPYNPAHSPNFTVNGGNGFTIGGGNAIINGDHSFNPSTSDDISWIRGPHQFGFGASYFHTSLNYKSGINSAGNMNFDGSTSGLGLADFLLGQAVTWRQGNVQSFLYERQQYFAAYAQDSWRATSRFTVNYGVRWEPFFAFTNKFGWLDHFDPALFAQNVHSTQYKNAPAGLIFPGDPQWIPGAKSIAKNRYGIFLPRLGLAWDPRGDGKMSIRASAGIFTDRGALYSMSAMAQDSPWGTNIQVNNVRMDDPWANYPGGNPLPTYINKDIPFFPGSAYVTDNPHWKPVTVNQFNFSIQRQIATDWLLTASYIGNTAVHMVAAGEINPAIFMGLGPCTLNVVQANGTVAPQNYPVCSTTANTNQRRVLYQQNPAQGQYYAIVSTSDDGGTMSYNALYLQAQKRLSRGITVLTNYTWSHCLSDLWNGNPGNTAGSMVTPGNRHADRGACDGVGSTGGSTDVRHIFNLSAVAQTPRFSNNVAQRIAGGWQFSPNMKIRSGNYITPNLGVDNALNGEGGVNQRPNLVPGINPYMPHKSVDGWLNPAAFVRPAPGTLGNSGRNTLEGPGMFQLDIAVSRTFPIAEKKTVQLRAEAFNLPNHLNPSIPVVATNQGSFGKIQSDISGTSGLSSGDPRILQFALKIVF